MTLRHLKIFTAVCQYGSVTAAAEALYMTQPAASLAISEMESYYGIKLFDRIGKRLYLTETGRRFLQYALHITDTFFDLENGLKDWDKIGQLRVGASVTTGNYLLPRYAIELKKRFPAIQLRASIHNSPTVESLVLKNEADLGLIEGSVHSDYLVSQKFMDDQMVFLCGLEHPWAGREYVRPEELKGEQYILRERESAGRETLDSIFALSGAQPDVVWESISTQAIVRAVQENLGVTLLPLRLVEPALQNGVVHPVRLEGFPLRRSFSIIHHKNKFLTAAAREFMKICLKDGGQTPPPVL